MTNIEYLRHWRVLLLAAVLGLVSILAGADPKARQAQAANGLAAEKRGARRGARRGGRAPLARKCRPADRLSRVRVHSGGE